MRKIKGASSYLKNQVRKNLAKATLCALVFAAIFSFLVYRILFTLRIDLIVEAGLVLSLVPLIAFYFYLRKYHIYNGGWQGEKQVADQLTRSLSDDYYLINDLYLRQGGGDIDHIVLGPNGIFVVETKNWSGNISSIGDEWKRTGKRNPSGSPSLQVKRNVEKIRRLTENSQGSKGLHVEVQGIVVFTNRHANLHVSNSTVPILKLPQLTSYITAYRRMPGISRLQLEAIGKEIVGHQKR